MAEASKLVSEQSTQVLSISGLRRSYGDGPILDGFDLELNKGDHTLILGASGSGKTTLINLICGLLSPEAGEITVCDQSISQAKATERDRIRREYIGFVPQQVRLVSALTLEQNLRLAQKLAGSGPDEDAIKKIVSDVGLSHRINAKPRQLSQGEAQRGAIARALIANPALLIADEPTAALDDANAERVVQLFLEAADAQGSTLLIATHDLRLKDHFKNSITL